jgi:AcrR family transcriptional regulator
MPDGFDLTPAESALLIVLMSEARPVSNKELDERFHLTLTGKSRLKLNGLKYVETWQEGRGFVHQLGEEGWARCRKELNFENTRPRALGAALALLLAGVHRDLERTDRSLAEMFAPAVTDVPGPGDAAEPAADLETRIRSAYGTLAAQPGGWVSLADLRAHLDGVTRDEVDAALRQLERAPDVNIVPESNQKALSAEDRGSAVRIGGQDKHFLAIGV